MTPRKGWNCIKIVISGGFKNCDISGATRASEGGDTQEWVIMGFGGGAYQLPAARLQLATEREKDKALGTACNGEREI